MRPTRRDLLRSLAATGALALFDRVARAEPSKLRLAPIRVTRERVVRTIVGLRPFRPSGYVVRSEQRGAKTIVHHYGHGGCGVTLSWGTAELAVAEVLRTGEKAIAVLGCGAVGLATARLLQQRGLRATIYARELPPHTLSDVAGARWYPFDFFDSKTASADFLANVWKVARVAYQAFAKLGPAYGVFYHPTYVFQNNPLAPNSLLNLDSPIRDLLPGLRELRPDENPTTSPVTRAFQTMMIEPAIYLPAVMRDHSKAGGTIVQRELAPGDVDRLEEKVIVNCTGLGAAALFGDTEMYPIKGQLSILPPQQDVDYVALAHGLYMFPRRDGIILGGTFERHVATLEPNRAAEDKILAGHAKFYAELK